MLYHPVWVIQHHNRLVGRTYLCTDFVLWEERPSEVCPVSVQWIPKCILHCLKRPPFAIVFVLQRRNLASWCLVSDKDKVNPLSWLRAMVVGTSKWYSINRLAGPTPTTTGWLWKGQILFMGWVKKIFYAVEGVANQWGSVEKGLWRLNSIFYQN